MKRRFSGALVGALVAGSISMAAPAQASAENCQLSLALDEVPQEELVNTGSPIQVYAGRIPGYAVAVAGWAASTVGGYGGCIANNVASCVAAVSPTLPLVEVDPDTLTVTVHQDNVIGDTTCIIDPR